MQAGTLILLPRHLENDPSTRRFPIFKTISAPSLAASLHSAGTPSLSNSPPQPPPVPLTLPPAVHISAQVSTLFTILHTCCYLIYRAPALWQCVPRCVPRTASVLRTSKARTHDAMATYLTPAWLPSGQGIFDAFPSGDAAYAWMHTTPSRGVCSSRSRDRDLEQQPKENAAPWCVPRHGGVLTHGRRVLRCTNMRRSACAFHSFRACHTPPASTSPHPF